MPYGAMPWVRQGRVVTPEGDTVCIDTKAWFRWLDHITCFCYSPPHGWLRLTVRREPRRRQYYWYAYSKIHRKLHNVYLGKSAQLTQAHLDQACQTIAQRARRRKECAIEETNAHADQD